MAAGNEFLLDLSVRCTEIVLGVKHLLLGGNIVALAGEQIDRTGDVLQV